MIKRTELEGIAFTSGVRSGAVLLWCVGFFLVNFDLIGIDIAGWRIPLCFGFFALAAVLAFWAEKREFSTRGALYRVHDLAIYSPWKYLLLFFLWVNIFAPFTAAPFKSVVYALGGWACLITVGFTAQFLFCERSQIRPVVLLRSRLRWVFISFCLAVICGALSLVFSYAFGLPSLIRYELNFLLFLLLGLPFLCWDILMRTRPLLPHALSVGSLCLILLLLGLSQRKVFWSGIVFCLVGMFALRVYKRMRLIPMAWFVFLFVAILTGAWIGPEYFSWLLEQKQNLEARMQVSILDALSIASKHRWLGMGIGQGTQEWGIWSQIVAEHGAMGIFLYGGFFAGLLWELYRIGREPRVVVSNVALLSVALFLLFVSHYYTNAYSPGIWVWYSIWSLLAASQFKKENV